LHRNDRFVVDVLCAKSHCFLTSTSLEIVLHISVKEKVLKKLLTYVLGFNVRYFLIYPRSSVF
jgi:hypothetical protein